MREPRFVVVVVAAERERVELGRIELPDPGTRSWRKGHVIFPFHPPVATGAGPGWRPTQRTQCPAISEQQ